MEEGIALDTELAELFQHYLQMTEASVRDSGIMASSDTSSTCSSLAPLSTWERLVRTHSIWFLPSLGLEEAAAILHNKEPGNFLIRRSLAAAHSCLSVKLGLEGGFAVHHFNIQEEHGCRMALDGSQLSFDNILSLVYHYQHVCGELPVRLALPEILRETEGRQHLSSLARLGKDFWRYPMSRPGRRSQLFQSPPPDSADSLKNRAVQQEDGLEAVQPSRRAPLSLSPLPARRRSIVSVLTVAPAVRPSAPQRLSLGLGSIAAGRVGQDLSLAEEEEEEEDCRMEEPVRYFKSCTEDKMSDYEDIWERTPGPESPGPISPTQSERRFREYLLSKLCDPMAGGEEARASPLSDRLSSSASPPSSASSTASEFSSSEEEDWAPEEESLESPEPLAVLEGLMETRVEECEGEDLAGHFTCCQLLPLEEEEEEGEGEQLEGGGVAMEEAVREVRAEEGRGSALRDTLERRSEGEEEEEEAGGRVGVILRKLSLRRSGSSARRSSRGARKPAESKRLSDVIGCYLGRKGPACQVDSSSWEFLDQNSRLSPPVRLGTPVEERRVEDPVRRQILLNSEAAEIGGQGCTLARGPEKAREGSSGASSSGDSVYQTDYSSRVTTGQSSSGVESGTGEEAQCKQSSPEKERSPEMEQGVREATEDPVRPPTLARAGSPAPGTLHLRDYLIGLVDRPESLFGLTVRQFVACTRESAVTEPAVVMRNMRQVMNGLKNYTVVTGEGELGRLIQRERERLRPDEFLNIDSVLEDVMQTLIILPLSDHLKKVFLADFTSSGCLQLVSENINFSLSRSSADFRVPAQFLPGLRDTVALCRRAFSQLAALPSPSDKLELLLRTVSALLASALPAAPVSVPSFCSLLAYLVVQTGVETLEVEAEWMWGLLHPSLLAGQGGHYLSLLSSALHLIKNAPAWLGDPVGSLASPLLSPTLLVLVPDAETGSLAQRSVPLRPGMTARDVARYVAHRLNIHNPEDFGLYSHIDGKDSLLQDDLQLRSFQAALEASRQGVTFLYKRSDSSILLPARLKL